MTWIEQCRASARYNRWMNEKIFRLVGGLDDGERKRDRGAFFKSIYGTLNHLLLADRVWLGRFTGDAERFASRDASGRIIQITSLAQELYPDFGDLSREREETDADILAWVHQLEEQALSRDFTYTPIAPPRTPQTHPLWWAVGHFFNHQTHHRGQVTDMLMQAGIDPGVTDLLAMLRDEARGR